MALAITHTFVSAVADSGDATLLQPSNWNDTHTLTGTASVAQGGTGLTAGTSGGIPYYSSTSAMTSSALLAAGGLVLGGGAGVAPATVANVAYDSTTKRLTIGTGSGTDQGIVIGYGGATGQSYIWTTRAAPDATNYLIGDNGGQTDLNTEGVFRFNFDGTTELVRINTTSLSVGSGYIIGFSSDTTPYGAKDAAFSRVSAGVIGVGTGAAASVAGSLSMNNCKAVSYTVGTTAGASFGPGAVASITVVNGIITAIS